MIGERSFVTDGPDHIRREEGGRETQERNEVAKVRTFFIRHSRATYATYSEKLISEAPETPIDINNQLPDIPEAGKELAESSAREFFSKFDPQKDVFYLVSSNQMRALETAAIYVAVAQELGFEVVRHEKTGTEVAANAGRGFIRSIEATSLNREKNQLDMSVFNGVKTLPEINWDAIAPKTKEQWEKARAIVLADDKGNWGANFAAYAQTVKDTVPGYEHIATPQSLYETQYQNLLRLGKFAREKSAAEKRVNIVAFGHENYMSVALEGDTFEESIANTEAVELTEEGKLQRFIRPE